MIGVPEITTDRLILRAHRLEDFEAVARFWASERSRHMGGPLDERQAWNNFAADLGQWGLRDYGMWMIEMVGTSDVCGWAGVCHPDHYTDGPELGWALFDGVEGRGIAFEAASAARNWAFETLGMDRLVSFIDTGNDRSIRLAKRLGATREDTLDRGHGPYHRYGHSITEALQ